MAPSPEKIDTAAAVLVKIRANDPHFAEAGDAMIMTWAEHLTIANIPRDIALQAVDRMYAQVDNPEFRPLPGVLLMHCRAIRSERVNSQPEQREQEWEDLQSRIERASDAKAVPDDPDYPDDWTLEQRLSAYWAKVQAFRDKREHRDAYEYPGTLLKAPPASEETRNKAMADVAAHLASKRKLIGPAAQYANSPHNPLRVACPHCKASAGDPCVIPGTRQKLTQMRGHPSRFDLAAEAASNADAGDQIATGVMS